MVLAARKHIFCISTDEHVNAISFFAFSNLNILKGDSSMGHHQVLSCPCAPFIVWPCHATIAYRDQTPTQNVYNCIEMTAGVIMVGMQWFLFSIM
jgi:hypothetical protein